jgi:arabinogalactan endo-1,4-beta-galactosidase
MLLLLSMASHSTPPHSMIMHRILRIFVILCCFVSAQFAQVAHASETAPKGTAVILRANFLNRFVGVDDAGGLVADRVSWDGRLEDVFIQITHSDGTVSFLSLKNFKFVTAGGTDKQVAAVASAIGPHEKFTIKQSWFSGWSDPGTDKAILSNGISTTWNIAGNNDGRIFSQWWDEASGWGNMSIMPVSLPHRPQIGADISEGKAAQELGVKYRDINGNGAKHYLDIFRAHGYQWVRCRINVNPDGLRGLYQSTSYVQTVLRDAKKRNFKLLLDFHFSDFWADPGHQYTPAAWTGQDLATLKESLSAYVTQVMNLLGASDTWPDMVQIGNETDSGMLWPLGGPWNGGSWQNYAALHNAAYDAITASRGARPMPKIMVHIAKGGDVGGARWWIDTALSHGMKFDVIGLSYYPMWHGTMAQLKSNLDNLSYRYPNMKIAIAETGHYFTPSEPETTPYPPTPQGQYDYLKALKAQVSLVKNADYIFYWGAAWTQPSKWYFPWEPGANEPARRSFFDETGRATIGIDGLR